MTLRHRANVDVVASHRCRTHTRTIPRESTVLSSTSSIIMDHNVSNKRALAEEFSFRGVLALNCYRYYESESLFRRAIALCPDEAAFYANRANAFYYLNQYCYTVQCCNAGLMLLGCTGRMAAHLLDIRGNAYRCLNLPELAIQSFSSAIRASPTSGEAYYSRGLCYNDNGRYLDAIEDFDSALALDSTLSSCYNDRGRSLLCLGRLHEALDSFTRAIKADPHYGNPFSNRGICKQLLGQFYEAEPDLVRSIELFSQQITHDPLDAWGFRLRGRAYRYLGKFEQAIADQTTSLQLDPLCAPSHTERGYALIESGRPDEAEQDFRAALAMLPSRTSQWLRAKEFHQSIALLANCGLVV